VITFHDHEINNHHWQGPAACGLLSARRSAPISGARGSGIRRQAWQT
jgi:hypothetical protein